MVLLQRDPAGRFMTSQRHLLWMAACLILSQSAIGQVFPSNPGGGMAPNSVFNNGYGPAPAFYPPPETQPEYLPMQGDQEPGALNNISYNQSVGDYGNVNVYGSPDAQMYGAGASFSGSPSAWLYLRDLQAAVYANPEQTVVNAGTTFSLYSSELFAIGGRALFGATVDQDLQDELHFSGDLFGGIRLPGEIWLKGGVLYDTQDSFYKIGPAIGAVFLADSLHPITVDFAHGTGHGDVRSAQNGNGLLGIADDDTQLRIGTYLSPMFQLGLSGYWARWDDPRFTDDTGIGGFARVSVADLDVTFDVTSGDLGTRGFVNVAYLFGGPHRKSWQTAGCSFVDLPQDWLTRPVMRDASLRVQNFVQKGPVLPPLLPGDAVVGNITQVACNVQLVPIQDGTNLGILDPGDGFRLLVTLGNGSNQVATNVRVSNVAADQGFVIFNSPPGDTVVYGNLPPGAQVTRPVPNASIGISPATAQGSSFNVTFDVTSDGVTRRFRCGPIVLGQTGNATPAQPATPVP